MDFLKNLNGLLYAHCQKVLPLVYDDSLSYYEVLCKLNLIMKNYIENQSEINEEVKKALEFLNSKDEAIEDTINKNIQSIVDSIMQEWKTDGTLDNLVASYFSKRLLANRARTTLFACNRVSNTDFRETNYAVQGFCIMKTKSKGLAEDYVVSVFRTGDDNSPSIIVARGLTTGTQLWKSSINVGHGNSLTWYGEGVTGNYGDLFVAVSGVPSNSVVRINGETGVVKTTYDLTGKSEPPTAICYSKTLKMFVFRSGENLYKANSTFMNVSLITDSLYRDPNPFYQGMWCDDTYLYQCNGHWFTNKWSDDYVRQQFVDIHFLDGTFYKRIKLDAWIEIEEGDIDSDGNCIIQGNYKSLGWLSYCSIYENLNTYNTDNKTYLNDMLNATNDRTIHINENYDGFFVDGSQSRPIPWVINIYEYALASINTLKIVLESDISVNINIKKANCNIWIEGQNHKVKGMFFSNINHVTVHDVEIYNKNDFENSLFTCFRPLYVALNNVKFKNTNATKPSRNIHTVGQLSLFLTDVVFDTPAEFNIDATEGAYVYGASLVDNTTQNSAGTDCKYAIGNSSSVFETKGTVKQMLYQIGGSEHVPLVRPLSPPFAIDSNKIRLACTLHVSNSYEHNFHLDMSDKSPISLKTEEIRLGFLRQSFVFKKTDTGKYRTYVRYYDTKEWSEWVGIEAS